MIKSQVDKWDTSLFIPESVLCPQGVQLAILVQISLLSSRTVIVRCLLGMHQDALGFMPQKTWSNASQDILSGYWDHSGLGGPSHLCLSIYGWSPETHFKAECKQSHGDWCQKVMNENENLIPALLFSITGTVLPYTGRMDKMKETLNY